MGGGAAVPEVVVPSQDADGLQGLAQAHVVAQDPVQLVFVQEGEPVHAVLGGAKGGPVRGSLWER